MVGFGPEDDHFVAELTYNYGVGEYQLGNDFLVGEGGFWTHREGQSVLWNEAAAVKTFLCLGPHPAIQPSSEQRQAPWVAPDSGGGSCVFNPGSWRISFLHSRQTTAFPR